MADKLVYDLQDIKEDRNTNLKPENLRAGITCLGVVGTMQSGIDTSDATAQAKDIQDGKTAYVNGQKITGTVHEVAEGEGFISDYRNIQSGGSTTTWFLGDYQIDTLIRTTGHIGVNVPNTEIASYGGITPEKIVQGNTIFGVEGTATAGGTDTSDATATANDIVKDKTAYVNGEKITGVISEVKADSSIGGSYSGPRYDGSTNTIYIEYNEDVDIYYFKYDIKNDTVLRQGAKVNYQMRRSGLRDYFEVSTEKIKSGEQIMGVTGSFGIEYMPNGFGDNDTTYYVEGDSSYVKDQEILVPYYDTDGGINKNFANVGNYAILNYRQMNEMTVEDTGYILTEVLSDMETGTDTMLAVKLKIKEILLP